MQPFSDRFDYIVVGAGAAGCIVAARLTENASVRVLLVEAGGSDRSPVIAMPAALPFAYQSTRLGWGYQSGPEPSLDGRSIDEKRGRVIGGSTSINAMLFNRGNPLDFEGWANAGLHDWSFAHCLPYFQRMETFADGPDDWRGGDGPMRISRSPAKHKLFDAFLRGGEQAGFEVTPDHNGYRQEGLHIAQAFIHNGVRWSAARGYLHPALARPNLTLLTGALVSKVITNGNSAGGIETSYRGRTRRFECEREVILCAGAFNSPKLLMLSGIGDEADLRRFDIRVVAHAPGVGRNLENHPGVNVQYATRHEDSLVSELGIAGRARLAIEWALWGTGLGASNFFEAGAFLRTRPDVDFPNMQFEFLPLTRQVRNGRLTAIPGFQFWMDLCRPLSRGAVTLRSADPAAPPLIVFRHLESREDVRDLIDGVRLAREMIQQPAWDQFRGEELAPGPQVQTDLDMERFITASLGTSYHPSGTCRMGADGDAVVDGEGRVKGVSALRVVDASIMPRIVSGNLAAATMMIAEKISDYIAGRTPLPPSTAHYYANPGVQRV